MNAKIILTTNANGVAQARVDKSGHWEVNLSLEGRDARCLAVDPNNTDIIYAGTQGQGVFRSSDAGSSWVPCGMEGQIVKSITVSPHDSNTIFAGTKPAYTYLSRDGGRSWDELAGFRHIPWRWWWFSPAETPYKAYVQAIAISPSDPEVVLAGIEFGAVVRSQDGGVSWSRHRKGALRDCHALKFHTRSGDWAYEAGGSGGGVSYSRDGGQTWRKYRAGLAKNYGVACAADPFNPELWYVSVAPGPGKAYGQQAEAYLYRKTADADWQPIGWQPHPMTHMPIALTTDPNTSGHLYAGLISGEVWFTADYGDSWSELPLKLGGNHRTLIVISDR